MSADEKDREAEDESNEEVDHATGAGDRVGRRSRGFCDREPLQTGPPPSSDQSLESRQFPSARETIAP